MDIRPLTDQIAVSPQIDPEDVSAIVEAGYRSIICNRPDGEDMGQPAFTLVEQAAVVAGLKVEWIPVSGGMIDADALERFCKALDDMPKPVLAYCRSGTRCTMLWAISQHGSLGSADIIECAAKAGYDMAPLVQQLDGT